MSRVLFYVMLMATMLYSLVGIFGYLSFANNTIELTQQNKGGIILLADYNNSIIMKISLILICFSVLFTFPLNIKPAKESLEQLLYPSAKKSSEIRHVILTLGKNINFYGFYKKIVVAVSSLLAAVLVENMGYVLTLMGSTITPLV